MQTTRERFSSSTCFETIYSVPTEVVLEKISLVVLLSTENFFGGHGLGRSSVQILFNLHDLCYKTKQILFIVNP